jgi:hypothetical protein
MDEREISELDRELRRVLRDAGLDRIVDQVDATIVEGRSVTERRKIDKSGPSEELVAVDYTARERYQLLLDAIRRAVVEPAAFEASAEVRLIERVGAASFTFLDPEENAVRTIGQPTSMEHRLRARDARRTLDRDAAGDVSAVLSRLDPRSASDEITSE